MRLRQIALVAKDLEPVVQALNAVFGLKVAFRDPAVGVFGLINAVMPVGGEFLEVVQPVKPDASAGRYLLRRGGDAGYMLIFQSADALAHRERLTGQGIRSIAQHDTSEYTFTHFHPGDFNGVLTSIDMVDDGTSWAEPMGKWPPAGRNWKDSSAPDDVLGIIGATVQARDPAAVAKRWSELLRGKYESDVVSLDRGVVRFIPPIDDDGTGVVGVDIAVRDPVAILSRAQKHGIPVKSGAVWIGGTGFRPVLPQA
jgi:hypothetical protein